MQGSCKGALPFVIPQASQDDCEAISGDINARDRLTSRGPKGPKPLGHPGFHRHHPGGTPRYNGAEPGRDHPAQAETGPVAMRGKMVISQRRRPHPLPLLQ
jgi:hypothetical protein